MYWYGDHMSGWVGAREQPPSGRDPEQLLAERFARGEIDEDEFHQRMTVLRAEAPHHPGPAGPPV